MTLQIDHIAVTCARISEGCALVESLCGVQMLPGGKHGHFGTHNMLLGLDNGLYLEVIAIDPDAPDPGRARWFDLDRFSGPPRLGSWICRSDDLEGDLAQAYGDAVTPVALRRGDLTWRMGIPRDGTLPFDNLFPAMIDWERGPSAGDVLKSSGCRLLHLCLGHPDHRDLADRLSGLVDDPRVTLEHADAPMMAAELATPLGQVVLR